jgi:hypothetical protein
MLYAKRLLIVAILLGFTANAHADAKMDEAKRHFAQGVALYTDGNFNAALAEFEAAYKIKQSPSVLYNIGLTQKALFRYNDAIDSLQQYIVADKKMKKEQQAAVRQLITEMKALLAEVTINVIPDGAAIKLDERTIGTAPMKPYGIAAGNHVLEITADGYKPQKKEILVSAGQPLAVNVKLEIIPKTGKAHIMTNQPLSEVKIDGKVVGMAPVDVELPLGGHQLEVTAKGYQPYRGELVVAGGQIRTVDVTLELPPAPAREKIYKKWYVWLPVTVLAASAVAVGLGVGLTQRPEPLVGTLDPGAQPVN